MGEEKGPEVSPADLGEWLRWIGTILDEVLSIPRKKIPVVVVLIFATAGGVWWFANRHIDEKLDKKDSQIEQARLEGMQKLSIADEAKKDLTQNLRVLEPRLQEAETRLSAVVAENKELRLRLADYNKQLQTGRITVPLKTVYVSQAEVLDRLADNVEADDGTWDKVSGDYIPAAIDKPWMGTIEKVLPDSIGDSRQAARVTFRKNIGGYLHMPLQGAIAGLRSMEGRPFYATGATIVRITRKGIGHDRIITISMDDCVLKFPSVKARQ
jgi:hypothetical protein